MKFFIKIFLVYSFLGIISHYSYATELKSIYITQAGAVTLEIQDVIIERATNNSPAIRNLQLQITAVRSINTSTDICGMLSGAILEGVASKSDRSIFFNDDQTRKVTFDKSKKMIKIHIDGLIAELSYEEGIKLSDVISKYYKEKLSPLTK